MPSKNIEAKLNDPGVILGMSRHLLSNFSRELQHNGRFDTDDLELIFLDLPKRQISISGWIDNYEDRNNREMYSIDIHYLDKNYSWDLNEIKEEARENIQSSNGSNKFYQWMKWDDGSEKHLEFKDGSWREYLAKVYLSSLTISDVRDRKRNLLL